MRLPAIPPADLDPERLVFYEEMRAGIAKGFDAFRSVDEAGALIGPWNASLHYPQVGKASWALTLAIGGMGQLPSRVKEVAILVVGGYYKAAYEIYAHTAVAERSGIPLAQISALIANIKPSDLGAEEAVAFDVAYALCRGGPLSEATWQLANATFGAVETAQLVYLVAIYAFVSMCLNGFDVSVPTSASPSPDPDEAAGTSKRD